MKTNYANLFLCISCLIFGLFFATLSMLQLKHGSTTQGIIFGLISLIDFIAYSNARSKVKSNA